MYLKKNESFSVDIIGILLRDQSDTTHAVSQLNFSPKNYRVSRFGCYITIFTAKNVQEIIMLRKF